MAGVLGFDLGDEPAGAAALRRAVRAFLAEASRDWTPELRSRSWVGFDAGFSRELAARGWVGMTWPKRYGGHERSMLERYVVIEELLAAGAPVGAHWVADRQSGPLLLRVGTEAQKAEFLPRMARGELSFCIGMSEPDAGSDLAALRARAVPVEGGWRLSGTKLWTTNAHRCHFMIGLFRSSGTPADRHAGLSQFLIDLASPGLAIRPIADLTGDSDFNELVFDDVFVPADRLLGQEGAGWAQVGAELALERSGPERYLSTFPLIRAALDALAGVPEGRVVAGRLVARLGTLRQMSLAIAGMLERGADPAREAALVKDLGMGFEQETPELLRALLDRPPGSDAPLDRMLRQVLMMAPSYSLRGGTREILRGIIAKGLGAS